MIDKKAFQTGIARMAAASGQEIPKERATVYWEVLSEALSTEEWDRAVDGALRGGDWFPKIHELLEYAKPKTLNSLKVPGRYSCAMCGNNFSFPASRERGYCGPCWRKIGGEAEDDRDERDVSGGGHRRIEGPSSFGELLDGVSKEIGGLPDVVPTDVALADSAGTNPVSATEEEILAEVDDE